MSRHRAAHRHRGGRRPFGPWHHGRHAIGALAEPEPVRALVAVPTRPRGPWPYDAHPATQPLSAVPAYLAIEPAIERRAA